ncbi:hypothetical protein FCM35_KLT22400 [Carex littledalei]|uniref:DUF7722 domain-containing protein n=1 Tax=Carex littledalei TaxID=544730 RepID=A0A833QGF3_9POAL|nr:hypothetical protein FCM35_KLT22400 [Carex littledalei]
MAQIIALSNVDYYVRPEGKKPTLKFAKKEGSVQTDARNKHRNEFQMPLRYPRYKREDYEKMEVWRLDQLLREYGLAFEGSVEEKRAYVMGTFLWPSKI